MNVVRNLAIAALFALAVLLPGALLMDVLCCEPRLYP